MASGTFGLNHPSGVGWWTACTISTAVAVAGTASTSATFVYSNTGMRVFQPSLPVAVTCLTPATLTAASGNAYATLQNGANTGLPAGVGICSVVLGTTAIGTNSVGTVQYQESGTLTVGFVNYAAAATVTVGTRLLFIQNQGN